MSRNGFGAKSGAVRAMRIAAEAVESRVLMSVSYAVSPVAAFGSSTDLNNGAVMDASGNLYGTTRSGGANNGGEIYEVAAGTGAITALASFGSSTGVEPVGTLVLDSEGNLYGVTQSGGANNGGTVFELPAGSNTISVLASFDNTSGMWPGGGLAIDREGNLYGFTQEGGSNNYGTVYELPNGSGSISVLASFTNSIFQPVGAPVPDASGDIFGNARFGGSNDEGCVFEVAAGSGSSTVVASFYSATTGEMPTGGLVMDSQGNLYGATWMGGANYDGAIFEVDPTAQTITTLASFSDSVGEGEAGTLLLDGQGDLFGTTFEGGENSMGTVFELPSGSNSIVALGSFSSDTGCPMLLPPFMTPLDCNLVMDSQGHLWGATGDGGPNDTGTIFEVAPVVATQVVITQQPTSVSAGSGDSLVVQMEDANGNLDTSINGNVTVTICSGPAGGQILGTSTVAAVDGVATLSGLALPAAGTYTFTVSEGSLTSATTSSFTVSPGAGSQLVFAQEPVGAAAGATLSPVVVDVEDAYGNIVTSDASQVTLTGNPGGAATTVAAQNGVATFDNLSFTTVGSYTLEAADGGLTGAQANAFTVTPGAASKLVITQQPAASTIGRAVSPIQVTVEDAFGNVVATDNSLVSLAISGAGPSILTGTTTAQAVNGVATFSNLSIASGGTFPLFARDASLATAESDPVTAPQLPSATAGSRAPMIAVSVNTGTTSGSVAAQMLHATLVSGPSGAKLAGTTQVKVKNGQASFSNLVFKQAGDYTVAITNASGTVVQEQTIAVAPATATHMEFLQQPTVQDGTISAAVALVDRYGNVVTTDSSRVTLKAGPYETQQGGILQGTVSVSAVDGVATFSDLTVTRAGLYRLIAKATGEAQAFSTIFHAS